MNKPALPGGPEAITAEWLAEALGGTIGGAKIDSIDRAPMGAVQGFTGQVVRVEIRYAGAAGDAPTSIVAKLHSADPKRRALFSRLGYSAREHRFYRDLAPRGAMRVPRCHYSDLDPASGEAVLLLEDLGGWTCLGGEPDYGTPEDAELVFTELARFQAAFWHDTKREDLAWLPSFALGADKTQETYRAGLWPSFVAKMQSGMPGLLDAAPAAKELGSRLGDRIADVKKQLAAAPLTLVHLDCRPDNLFVSRGEAGPRLALIDWENAALGRGPIDLAYFISGLPTELRRASEGHLLRRYHATLVDNGVRDYSFDECMRDYRLSFVQPYVAMVYGVTVLDMLSTPRGRQVNEEVLTRLDAAIGDHGVLDLLS